MSPRRRLLRWTLWFGLAHAGVIGIAGLRYLWHYDPPSPAAGWLYAALAYAGHMSALAYVPLLALLAPVILLIPRPSVVVPFGVVLASAGLSLLVVDSLVFAENRYHLGAVTVALLAPRTWAFAAVYFALGVVVEAMVAAWVWRRTAGPLRSHIGHWIAVSLALCFLTSHLVYAWADAHYFMPVTAFTRHLPLYYPLRDTRIQERFGLLDRTQAREHHLIAAVRRVGGGELNYPLAPLHCPKRGPSWNVLLIVVDAMRADALTPELAPHVAQFAEDAVRFEQHYSGGNSSRAGMFSLFYGLPPTYWEAFDGMGRTPVLMDMFQERGYQLGLFSSAPVYRGVGLDRTAFARVRNLRLETASAPDGSSGDDRVLTEEWQTWLDRADLARPFFGFLYYNAAVALEPPANYPAVVATPPGASAQRRRYARYAAAVHYVDSLVGRVLADLDRRKLAERTIVIVTSDHGMEFDENGRGFTGHGTAFSAHQMHTPFVIRWPGKGPERVARRTSHNDVASTLLADLFGCENPAEDFSSGHDLFTGPEWSWLVASSYTGDFALIEPLRVTIVSAASYEIRDSDYRLISSPVLPRDELRAALREMTRFYR
jgi:membrane-anchored protein YejM (alkaline phosphatase superfamily)